MIRLYAFIVVIVDSNFEAVSMNTDGQTYGCLLGCSCNLDMLCLEVKDLY